MKKTILAAAAMLTMASCAKENSTTELIDPTAPVAATFTSASITRVTDSAWDTNDKIGITMVATDNYTLATGSYENVPYTVGAAGTSGTFSADDEIIYFPVDGTEVVDFIAYYPYSTADTDKNIAISVAEQDYAHIDLVAAKAVGKTKLSPTVTFSDTEAFSHQLSKLTMNIVAGDGIDALTDIKATIKGQYTTAKYNIYTSAVVADATADITALTTSVTAAVANPATPAKATINAIMIPTDKIAGSTIEFAVGGNTYYLDTKDFVFTKGCEHTYTITLTRTGATISGATISNWGTGAVVDNGELDASDYVAPTVTQLEIAILNAGDRVDLTVNADNAVKVHVLCLDSENSAVTAADITGSSDLSALCIRETIEKTNFGSVVTCDWDEVSVYVYAVAEDENGNLSEIMSTSATL